MTTENLKETVAAIIIAALIVVCVWIIGILGVIVVYDFVTDALEFSFWQQNPSTILILVVMIASVIVVLGVITHRWFLWLMEVYYKQFCLLKIRREQRMDLEMVKRQSDEKIKALQEDYNALAKKYTVMVKHNKRLLRVVNDFYKLSGKNPSDLSESPPS